MAIAKKSIALISALILLVGIAIYSSRNSPIVYQLLSTLNCPNSFLPVCNSVNAKTVQPTATGKNGAVVSTQKRSI